MSAYTKASQRVEEYKKVLNGYNTILAQWVKDNGPVTNDRIDGIRKEAEHLEIRIEELERVLKEMIMQ